MEKTKKKFTLDRHCFVYRHSTAIFWVAVALTALLIPFFSPGRYLYRVMSMIGIYSILALGLNLVVTWDRFPLDMRDFMRLAHMWLRF